MATRHDTHRSTASALVRVVVLLALAGLVMLLAERGAFAVFSTTAVVVKPAIPGITLDASAGDNIPVVTSLRTHSEAERLGVRVGDRIQAVDGRQVRDLAALREAVAQHSDAAPVSLKIQRGDSLWDVALDRAEPSADEPNRAVPRDDPKDIARRGR